MLPSSGDYSSDEPMQGFWKALFSTFTTKNLKSWCFTNTWWLVQERKKSTQHSRDPRQSLTYTTCTLLLCTITGTPVPWRGFTKLKLLKTVCDSVNCPVPFRVVQRRDNNNPFSGWWKAWKWSWGCGQFRGRTVAWDRHIIAWKPCAHEWSLATGQFSVQGSVHLCQKEKATKQISLVWHANWIHSLTEFQVKGRDKCNNDLGILDHFNFLIFLERRKRIKI